MASESMKKEFLESYDAYADAIYRHCVFRVFSKEKAEDLTQETFTRFWHYLSSGKRVDNARALLYRIATNLIIDGSRKKKESRLEELLENSPSIEPSIDEASAIEDSIMMKEVLKKLHLLNKEEQIILTMRYIDDLGPKDIAEILHTNANNVSVKLNRALKALQKHFPKIS